MEDEIMMVEESTENEAATSEENVEQVVTSESKEPEKVYTEEEFNAKLDELLSKKIARKEAKLRKEYEQQISEMEALIKAGAGKDNVEEAMQTTRQYYESKGIKIPTAPQTQYSQREAEILAQAEANEIIQAGLEDVVEEVERLKNIGLDKMNAKEKAMFKTLATHRQNAERANELAAIGVTEEVYNSDDFKAFASKFDSKTPMKDVYDIYSKMQPKKEIRQPGSMVNTGGKETGVKEFYTPEEARAFTKADFDKNPALWKAVNASQLKWKS
jgi:hypothetical protein